MLNDVDQQLASDKMSIVLSNNISGYLSLQLSHMYLVSTV